jgi:hypothetical protein
MVGSVPLPHVVVLALVMLPRPADSFSQLLLQQPTTALVTRVCSIVGGLNMQTEPVSRRARLATRRSETDTLLMQTMEELEDKMDALDDTKVLDLRGKKRKEAADDVRLRRVWAIGTKTFTRTVGTAMPSLARGQFVSQAALMAAIAAAASAAGMEINGVHIAESLMALSFGVLTVSAATAAIDARVCAHTPPFDPATQRFDQSEFGGRYCQMLLACDPRLLLYSREQVERCKTMVDNYQGLKLQDDSPVTDRALWDAKRIVDAALSDTGTWIPRPFRMSGYLPFNGPICIAMLVMSSSTGALLFWSWLNQSQNALINYFNRNASSELTTKTLLQSYSVAVGAALAVAFGLCTFIQGHYSGEEAAELLKFVAFPSAVLASTLNCYIVRRPEMDSGVPLLHYTPHPDLSF